MNTIGVVLGPDLVAELQHLRLVRDVDDMRGDAQALRQALLLAQPLGLRQPAGRDVAGGNAAALGHELAHQLAAHSRAASRNNGQTAQQVFHQSDRIWTLRHFSEPEPYWSAIVPASSNRLSVTSTVFCPFRMTTKWSPLAVMS